MVRENPSILGGQRFSASPDVIGQQLDQSIVLINLQTDHFFELNATGARLWELLISGNTLDQAAEQLCREFDVDPPTVVSEMQSVVDSLISSALLVRADESSGTGEK
jgi:hypothetical protein